MSPRSAGVRRADARRFAPASICRRAQAPTRCRHAPAGDRARGQAAHRAVSYSSSRGEPLTTSLYPTRHAGNLRVNLLRRHPVAIVLVVLLLATAIHPLSPLVDAVTGSAPGDVDLERPVLYVLFAPLSNTLDALTFFSLARAEWALTIWVLLLAAWGAVRASSDSLSTRRVVAMALLGPALLVLLAGAAVLLPRPVPRLVHDGAGTVLDFHTHTNPPPLDRPG